MSTHTYTALFEITDARRPAAALYTEACTVLDAMAAEDGARIVGDPTWQVTGRRLVIECPAEPLEGGEDPRMTVDEIAVERACTGEPIELNKAERHAAIMRLHHQGLTPADIGRRLNIAYATVYGRVRTAA